MYRSSAADRAKQQTDKAQQKVNNSQQVACAENTPCVKEKLKNDKLAQDAAKAMEKATGQVVDATATEKSPHEGQPYMTSSDISNCKSLSYRLQNQGTLRRFNRYREAMPYANAALEMNELSDDSDDKKKQKKRAEKCLTMLPDSAEALNAELGLPPKTLTDKDLRDDTTGFRAAIYRSEVDGKLILVARDTQPQSLVDWKTNTDNGQGIDTDQYQSMRNLAGILNKKGVDFDVAGYSKGGGLAQEAGLVSTKSNIMVFNSAGLHDASLKRTGQSSFDSLSSRTQSFSAEGDFLTFMNDTSDSQQQITNAQFLRNELAGEGAGYNPMNIKYRNPQKKKAEDDAGWFGENKDPDPAFDQAKQDYLAGIDTMIGNAEAKQQRGESFRLFPPVQSEQKETIPNSIAGYNLDDKVKNENPNLAKLIQHLMTNVTSGLEKTIEDDKKSLEEFVKECG